MKASILTIPTIAIVLLSAVGAMAQWGWNEGYHASTAGEGYARGMADVIRSEGEYNLTTSQAAINMTEARRREIENQKEWTDTYFRMREMNREYRAKEQGPRKTREDWIRYAQMGKPNRLSPSELDTVSGIIHWPTLLKTDAYSSYRAQLDELFAERAQTGSMSGDGLVKANQITKAMLEDLKGQITQVPSSEYMRARKFIESLAYESKLPNS